MKLKKLLSLALCACMLLGMCAAYAEETTCAHANAAVSKWEDRTNATYESLGDVFHKYTAMLYQMALCPDCNTSIRTDLGYESDQELHDYKDNVCTQCGHVNTCAHENTDVNQYIRWDASTICTAIDNEKHAVTGKVMEEIQCNDCGAWIFDGVVAENGTIEEQHSYENGVCEDCGYVNTCTHENTNTNQYIEWDSRTFEPVDNRKHLVKGKLWEEVWCRDCHTGISDVLINESGSMEEYHYYVDGVCEDCGYANTCAHENTWSEQYVEYDKRVYAAVDGKKHTVSGPVYENVYCDDCEATVSTTLVSENGVLEENHQFEDSECYLCGYVNTCAHENTYTNQYIGWESDTTYEAIDNAQHKVTGKLWEDVICEDCNELISEKVIAEQGSLDKNHRYIDGVCKDCGHTNACAHEWVRTIEEIEWDDSRTCEAVNDAVHMVKGKLVERIWCMDCRSNLSRKIVSETGSLEQNHYYVNGKCEECGHTNGCAHANTKLDRYASGDNRVYEILNNDVHKATGTIYESVICADCEIVLSNNMVAENDTIEEEHYFLGGKCTQCGHVYVEAPTAEPTAAPTAEPTAAPTAEPTAAPTAEPTAAPTAEPEDAIIDRVGTAWVTGDRVNVRAGAGTDYEKIGLVEFADKLEITARVNSADSGTWYEFDYNGGKGYIFGSLITFDGRPVPTAKPAAKPTAEPTAEPTAAPTAEPTAAPTAEPTAEPAAEPELTVDAMMAELDKLETKSAVVEVVNAGKVYTEEEKAAVDALPVKEQMLVLLAAIGHKDAVESMLTAEENALTISVEAQTAMDAILARLEAMTEEEKAAFEEELLASFPFDEIELEDGTKVQYFAIELTVTEGDETRVERYGFRYDEENEAWIFTQMEAAE